MVPFTGFILLYLLFFLMPDRPINKWVHPNFSGTRVEMLGFFISCLFYVCVSCAVAIVVGKGLKVMLARYRPVMLFESGQCGLHFFSAKWHLNSTPSGHALRIFSIMTALSVLLPRGHILFIAITVLVGISPVAVTIHYPCDVLFGAFIGIFSAL